MASKWFAKKRCTLSFKHPFSRNKEENEEDVATKTKALSESSFDESEKNSNQPENTERGNWGHQIEFLLSCIGYAVGLGNIWRFPYLCMKNGGGAFLIPYFFFMFFFGVPLFFMELSLGQFSSTSPLSIWGLCPLFKGLGYGMFILSGSTTIYYNAIMAWVLYYLFSSFTSELPWLHCQNTTNCEERITGNDTNLTSIIYSNASYMGNDAMNLTLGALANDTIKKMTPAEQFWQYSVLQLSPGIDQLGYISWQLMLCLLLAWFIVFVCLSKGVESSGKVVYVTATAPYLFLTILLVRGLTLDGAMDGIKFFLTPDFKILLNAEVWALGALQIFFSLGPGWGSLITMSSYNKFHNNVYRDAMIVPIVNCLTSFYAGFVIFSVIGFMAKEANTSVEDVITQGPGLAFVAYPEALTRLPISPMWAICFFLMLLTIGLDSQFGMLETVISGIIDEYPQYLRSKKVLACGAVCALQFLLGLPLVTQAGVYIFQIMDWYIGAMGIMIIAFSECVIVAWVYGATRFRKEIAMMTSHMPSYLWEIVWKYISPTVILLALVIGLQGYGRPTYGDYQYPDYVVGIGWTIASLSVIPIPTYMIYLLYNTEGSTLLERIKKQLKPSKDWGPWLDEYRVDYDPLVGPLQSEEYYTSMAARIKQKSKEDKETQRELLDMTSVQDSSAV